ncbi:hypothetical protein E4T56_gene6384 [Termitomyces sp. T112]|nr:hypothetical protein E4T56_gene6384 [Termitomyces sp. T112]KAH0584873.1 hypothetical protein H2248_008151 [Termitomyces sp. 'cryptogamus']
MTSTPTTSAPGDGSRTHVITDSEPYPESSSSYPNLVGTLRLRTGPRNRQRVVWKDDVVDNEGCGRKSSKICCIYHKPRKFDESSSEDDSDSDSDSSLNIRRPRRHIHDHDRDHDHKHHNEESNGAGPQVRSSQSETVCELEKDEDHNAYERMPSSNKGKQKAGPSS